uniref:Soluble calcium-activated nucleotidase 1 n=1 Tax=Meloidogyne incognita TaxID=6306 RepID=A0A914KLV2_MELIC
MTFTENVKNEDENFTSFQNTPFSSNSEKHKNNHINNRRTSLMLISNCFSFSVAALIISLLIAFFSLQYYLPKALDQCSCVKEELNGRLYNSSSIGYPKHLPDGRIQYQIAVVSDLDHDSKFDGKKNTWRSFVRRGRLYFHPELLTAQIQWNEEESVALYSQLSSGGRAMELSDLAVFDGNLLTVDDRTGVIYKIDNFNTMIPWAFLNDGPGNTTKGFKAEWMSVKDGHLFVGGLGKEWTTTQGVFQNYHPMWIKIINLNGEIVHANWTEKYIKIREAVGIKFPGYLIHESAQWSDVHKKWFFLPRRASNDTYSEDTDEHKGTNMLIMADENFTNIEATRIGSIGDGSRGFSAFQFLPGSDDQFIVALKSEERDGKAVASYLCFFRLSDGQFLIEEQKFDGPYKFEGLIIY